MGAWVLAVVAGVVLVYALVSRPLDRTPVTAGIFFLSAGLVFGNEGLGWIDISPRGETVRLLAEATLTRGRGARLIVPTQAEPPPTQATIEKRNAA